MREGSKSRERKREGGLEDEKEGLEEVTSFFFFSFFRFWFIEC